MEQFSVVIKAPDYPPQLKHKVIFETFDKLTAGEVLLLINDHDPKPLYYQFKATRDGQFSWEYVERGPEQFRVKIGKQRSCAE